MDISILTTLFWCFACFYSGINVGRSFNIQYSEPEGKLSLITISEKFKFLFFFNGKSNHSILKASVTAYIVCYLFSLTEFICFIMSLCFRQDKNIFFASNIIGYSYGIWLICFSAFVGIKYSFNMHAAFDCDWITDFQRALTVLPKRRCKIVAKLDDATYLISLNGGGKRKYIARSSCSVIVGSKLFAVHSCENGKPFWTIRDH